MSLEARVNVRRLRPKNMYRLSFEDELKVIAWYRKGEKVSFILDLFELSWRTFRRIRDRHDVPLRPSGRPKRRPPEQHESRSR